MRKIRLILVVAGMQTDLNHSIKKLLFFFHGKAWELSKLKSFQTYLTYAAVFFPCRPSVITAEHEREL